jgi:hypothetical protein
MLSHFGLWVFFQANHWRNEAVFYEGFVDGRDEAGGQARFDDVGGAARVQSGVHVVRVFMQGEKHELRAAPRALQLPGGFNAVQTRRGNVEHDAIRIGPIRLSEEFAPIAYCTDDEAFVGQHGGRQREHPRMIISQQQTRALYGAGARDGGSSDHGAIF